MTAGLIVHWIAASLLIAMATFALIEARSSSLIPKSLFLWPFFAFLFGILTLLGSFRMLVSHWNGVIFLVLGIVIILASAQAFLVNIRKISRWPSGMIWLVGLSIVGILYQVPYALPAEEPLFQHFIHRLSGFLWAAIGVTKMIEERTVSEGSRVPTWITLLYVQAILIASLPH
ncbi:MAG: hypothetical protein HY582_00765 [Candidatus Omnitrophica bacterium]|nr:hypothetical protein [Candidatus Omnitrophota bacterium]